MNANAEVKLTPPAADDEASRERVFRWILIGFALVCAVVLTMVVVATRNLGQAAVAGDAVNQTQTLVLDANELLSQLYASDMTMRAYIASGSQRERSIGRATLNQCIDRLVGVQSLARGNEAQRLRLSLIDSLVHQRVDFIREMLDSDTPESRAASSRLVEADAGWYALRQIKTEIDQLRQSALGELALRNQENYRQAQTTRWTVWTGLTLNVLLLGGMAALLRHDFNARRARTDVLQNQNNRLEEIIESRTRALRAANEQLEDDMLEQKWARLALDHQLHYNQLVINSIREAVFVITRALHISRINPAVPHLTGRPVDDILNRPLRDIIRLPQSAPGAAVNQALLDAMADGQDLRNQPATLIDRTGREFAVIANLFPLRDSGNVVGAVLIIDDPLLYSLQPTNEFYAPHPLAQIK